MLAALSPGDISRLADIVREETGNQVMEKNHSMLESRIRSRLMKLGLPSMEKYWEHFSQHEREEREVLKSLMTTHYTFFFREYAHFEALEKWVTQEAARLKERHQKSQTPVQVWSAACSRGQEVYSLAMFLQQVLLERHGVPFEILGTDIDAESVQYAKNGVYPIKEVNTIPNNYLRGYWKRGTGPIKEFAAVHPSLKAYANFETLNLLEVSQWRRERKFDVIFCRNVFIYFSEDNVKKIASSLADTLANGGLFISGVSEPLRFPGWDLQTVGPSCYFKSSADQKRLTVVPSKQEPIAPPSKPIDLVANAPAATEPAFGARKYHVLCVDDSKTIQNLIKSIFAKDPRCTKVSFANNGREARERLDSETFDLITLDIHMPEVNGIEFLEQLYRRSEDPPVLMVSSVSRTDVELATRSLSLGAFDYVEKPEMNNLKRSADEILTKANMALRARRQTSTSQVTSFDASISQRIVVPDASLCLRVVTASPDNLKTLEQIVKGQNGEYRSPPLLIAWNNPDGSINIEQQVISWTDRTVLRLREAKATSRPNHVLIANRDLLKTLAQNTSARSVSLQILDHDFSDLEGMKGFPKLQVLLDEAIQDERAQFTRLTGLTVSDLTPAISFPSLSLEYFANLRKAAA